jgi:hypothetical protein
MRTTTFGESETRRIVGYDGARSRAPFRIIVVHFSPVTPADRSELATPNSRHRDNHDAERKPHP